MYVALYGSLRSEIIISRVETLLVYETGQHLGSGHCSGSVRDQMSASGSASGSFRWGHNEAIPPV